MKHIATLTTALGSILTLALSLCACVALPSMGGDSWKEEVLLHDGQKIVAERYVKRGGRHEVGQKGSYVEQTLSFTLPSSGKAIEWKDSLSEDLGNSSFLPMLLDIADGTPYLVAYPMGCLSYNKWGRPNPPYVVFKYTANAWQRIALTDLPLEIKTPNLIFSSPDDKVEELGQRLVKAETIQQIVSGTRQPEYKTILREPVKDSGGWCPAMISYGKTGGWIGLDWFTDQPSVEACLKFCEHKKVSAETCPCDVIFKGKK